MLFPLLPTFYAQEYTASSLMEKKREEADIRSSSYIGKPETSVSVANQVSESADVDRFDSASSSKNTFVETAKVPQESSSEASYRDSSRVVVDLQNTYSNTYIRYNTDAFITSIIGLISIWKDKGTNDSTSEISQIKSKIESYSVYLEQLPETNILLGALETIFEDDNWETLNSSQLDAIMVELENFETGKVTWKSLEDFSRTLWAKKIA